MSYQHSGWLSISKGCVYAAIATTVAIGAVANAQTVRNYNVQLAPAPPVIDGVVSAGEWNAAAPAAGMWGVLRETAADVDTENNRFRMMWDANNLYMLYETDFNIYADADKVGDPNPNITFATGENVINLYFDPNTDDEPNFVNVPETNVDGYQVAFWQRHDPDGGSLISTDANRQGIGFFTEAHLDTPFGDQANWNRSADPAADEAGAALQDIVVAQRNDTTGGVFEMIFPWANFNAAAVDPTTADPNDFDNDGRVDGGDFLLWQRGLGLTGLLDKSKGDANDDDSVDAADLDLWKAAYGTQAGTSTGLSAVDGPMNGDQWFFNIGRQNSEGDVGNFLPYWNWQPAQVFANRPHGTITFMGAPISAVPEPAAMLLMTAAAAAALVARRRRAP